MESGGCRGEAAVVTKHEVKRLMRALNRTREEELAVGDKLVKGSEGERTGKCIDSLDTICWDGRRSCCLRISGWTHLCVQSLRELPDCWIEMNIYGLSFLPTSLTLWHELVYLKV